jgi:hypothetical protein
MRILTVQLLAIVFAATSSFAVEPRLAIFIEPQEGFDSYISAAIVKKQVPASVTVNKEAATHLLTSRVQEKEESGASKVARCLFAYCAGINGNQTATVQLIDAKTSEVVWADNVRKGGSKNYQSSAEAIAKHLKNFLSKKR